MHDGFHIRMTIRQSHAVSQGANTFRKSAHPNNQACAKFIFESQTIDYDYF